MLVGMFTCVCVFLVGLVFWAGLDHLNRLREEARSLRAYREIEILEGLWLLPHRERER